MRDDQELYYASGEMSDADLLAFEQSLSGSAKHEAANLKEAFASLRTLNDGIPEPQISFDRVRYAIESAPVAKPVMPWQRWTLFATPVAALALVAMFASRSSLNNAPVVDTPTATPIAKTTTPSEPALGAVDTPAAITKESTVAKVVEPKVTISESRPGPALASRRSGNRRHSVATLVASNRDFPHASSGLPKHIDFGSNEVAPIAAAPDISPNGGGTESISANGGSAKPMTGHNEPVVVVVTSTPDSQTGANTAVEVTKQNDVVLGG